VDKILNKVEKIENSKFGLKKGKVFSEILAAGLAVLSIAPIVNNNLNVFAAGKVGSDRKTEAKDSFSNGVLIKNKYESSKFFASLFAGMFLGGSAVRLFWHLFGRKSAPKLTLTQEDSLNFSGYPDSIPVSWGFSTATLNLSFSRNANNLFSHLTTIKGIVDRVMIGAVIAEESIDYFSLFAKTADHLVIILDELKSSNGWRNCFLSNLSFLLLYVKPIENISDSAPQEIREYAIANNNLFDFSKRNAGLVNLDLNTMEEFLNLIRDLSVKSSAIANKSKNEKKEKEEEEAVFTMEGGFDDLFG
jgi:hypothetical protein